MNKKSIDKLIKIANLIIQDAQEVHHQLEYIKEHNPKDYKPSERHEAQESLKNCEDQLMWALIDIDRYSSKLLAEIFPEEVVEIQEGNEIDSSKMSKNKKSLKIADLDGMYILDDFNAIRMVCANVSKFPKGTIPIWNEQIFIRIDDDSDGNPRIVNTTNDKEFTLYKDKKSLILREINKCIDREMQLKDTIKQSIEDFDTTCQLRCELSVLRKEMELKHD